MKATVSFALAFPALLLIDCRRAYQVGDHVFVEWRGIDTPAVIVAIEGSARFRVHYDGFADDWDESIPGTRVRGRITDSFPAPPAAAGARAKAFGSGSASASIAPASVYRAGDHVRVEWHGNVYGATVVAVLDGERYRVRYDTYGSEWDEDITLSRIKRK